MVLVAVASTVGGVVGGAANVLGGILYSLLPEESQASDTATEYISLYHHTDRESAAKIARSGMILQSQAGAPSDDAAFGDGTYLTSLGPDKSPTQIADNNYDGRIRQSHIAKTAVAIEVRVKIAKAGRCNTDRDVYLYKGDLHFKDVKDVRFHIRNQNGGYSTYSLEQFKRL